jgi:hypothetical protein
MSGRIPVTDLRIANYFPNQRPRLSLSADEAHAVRVALMIFGVTFAVNVIVALAVVLG